MLTKTNVYLIYRKSCKKMKTLLILLLPLMFFACVDEGEFAPKKLNTWLQFTTAHGLVDNQVTTLFEDSQGRLWIGTSDGLSVRQGNSFTNYTVTDGLLSNFITSIAEDLDGDIWVGTPNGINVWLEETWYYLTAFEGVAIYALYELQNQHMLIGTDGYGAVEYNLFNNDITAFYYDNQCASCNVVNALFQDSGGKVWIGTESGLTSVSGQMITSFTTANGLSGNSVLTITGDRWGNIWAGTFDGQTISRIYQNQVVKVNLANTNTQNWVWDILADTRGKLWISTAISGLYHYDGAFMRKDFDHLPDEYVSALLQDANGDIWIGTLFDGLIRHTPN
jgi:ligand-binding sensor domain-containing protein